MTLQETIIEVVRREHDRWQGKPVRGECPFCTYANEPVGCWHLEAIPRDCPFVVVFGQSCREVVRAWYDLRGRERLDAALRIAEHFNVEIPKELK